MGSSGYQPWGVLGPTIQLLVSLHSLNMADAVRECITIRLPLTPEYTNK